MCPAIVGAKVKEGQTKAWVITFYGASEAASRYNTASNQQFFQ
jgi:hypothetical protein